MNRFLSRTSATQFLQKILEEGWHHTYDPEKHRLEILDQAGNGLFSFRLPLAIPFPLRPAGAAPVRYVVLLVQSGSAALGYFEDGKNLDHKVI